MYVYLVQHGKSKSEEKDPKKSLTEEGAVEAELVAIQLVEREIQIGQIVHSGKTRAEQTAAIFAEFLKPAAGVKVLKGIGGADNPTIAKQFIEKCTDNVMLVGHLPHLQKLAVLLTGQDVEFQNAGVVCLSFEDNWQVAWEILPGHLH